MMYYHNTHLIIPLHAQLNLVQNTFLIEYAKNYS